MRQALINVGSFVLFWLLIAVLYYAIQFGLVQFDRLLGKGFCRGCKKEVDRETCWCGAELRCHPWGAGHDFVAMGCDCYRAS